MRLCLYMIELKQIQLLHRQMAELVERMVLTFSSSSFSSSSRTLEVEEGDGGNKGSTRVKKKGIVGSTVYSDGAYV